APVLTRDYILIRTISSLAALSRTSKPDLIWRLPLQTWFDLPPIASDDQAFIFDGNTVKNFGQILAVKLSNSSITWHSETDGITMQPAALTNEAIIFQNGKHQISALDFIDGHTQWTADFDKIYTPPMITNQSVLCVSREQVDDGNSTHYSLNALDTATGIPLWQSPLPARVRIPPAVNGENIFLATSDGRLLAIDSASHEKVFEKSIGTELDPPAAELMIDDGILYSCSSSGMLSAIRVETANPARLLPPEDYLKSNNFELAAAAYALQGDFKNAAAIFANRLQDIKKALVLYDAAGMYDEAASISSQHGFLAEAEYYYQLAGDPLNQAKMLLKRSDDAPNKAVYAGQLRRAVELLNKVGQDDRELDTLVKLSEIKPEKVLFERIIKLARICARYGDEAAAWEKINNPVNAADAYRRAGVLAEQEKPQNKNVIVGYFKKAAQLFSECGKDSDSYQCQNEIAMLEELPIINIKIKQLIELKEGKWSIIGLVLQNIGYGIAQQISWHILPGRFEFETAAGIWNYKSLGIGSEKEVQINIRPNIGEAGDAVPMIIEWQWINLDGKRIQHRTSVSLNVMAQKSIVKTGSAMTRANDLSKTYKARMKRLGRNIK
ncbi:MAG: PQQ-binding-like beta-propeller repeat protein, partial [Chloroflexota bacterium]